MLAEVSGALTRLRQWIREQAIQDVPADIALCEFDCRKGQCSLNEWQTCQRRLTGAAGELSPRAESVRGTVP
jgi:hypothetical protein